MPEIPQHIINAANNARETGPLIDRIGLERALTNMITNHAPMSLPAGLINRNNSSDLEPLPISGFEMTPEQIRTEENRRINDRLNMATDPDIMIPLEHHYDRGLEIMARERTALEQTIYEDTMRREGFEPPSPPIHNIVREREYSNYVPDEDTIRYTEINGHLVPYHSSDRTDATNLALNNISPSSDRTGALTQEALNAALIDINSQDALRYSNNSLNENTRIPDHLIRPNAIIPIPIEPLNDTVPFRPFRIPFDRIHTPSYPIDATPLYENMDTEERIRSHANLIGMDYPPKKAYEYALSKNTPQPDLEPRIAGSAQYSFLYAKNVLKGRFELGEPSIATNLQFAFYYAKDILKGRFIGAETKLLIHPSYKQDYIDLFITPEINNQIQSLRSPIDNSITILDLP